MMMIMNNNNNNRNLLTRELHCSSKLRSNIKRERNTDTLLKNWCKKKLPNESYNNNNNFAIPDDHRIKLTECEKKDKYFDLAWELKTVTIIPIVIGAFGTVTKNC